MPESFPHQSARTHKFGAGLPRLFHVSPDGDRVLFVRSRSGDDVVGRLWRLDLDEDGERLLVDPEALADQDLPAEELARRERTREQLDGVVSYSTDESVRRVALALSGALHVCDVDAGRTRVLDVPGPVLDPRISPDGRWIAYVHDRGLHVVPFEGGEALVLASPGHDTETVGLTDFIAAEELQRHRGFWWSPDSDALLAAVVDVAAVQQWWIADPAHPQRAPRVVRYPSAGTPNASVRLEIVRLGGTRTPVTGQGDDVEYLVDVHWDAAGAPLVVVATRDQRTFRILAVDTSDGSTSTVDELRDDAWVEVTPRATRWSPDGRLLTLRADHDTDTYRLRLDGSWLTPAGMQVRGVVHADENGVVVTTAPRPTACAVVRVGWDGSLTPLSPETGWHVAAVGGDSVVLVSRELVSADVEVGVRRTGRVVRVGDVSERPHVTPQPTLLELTDRRLVSALLLPHDRAAGSGPLPVVLSPYGGPHAQRVIESGLAFGEQQWIADQGFAVLVVDGRGTPGRGPAWDRSVHGDLAGPALADQLDALSAAAALFPDDLDLSRVGIRGWSFGGYLAALAVLTRPDVVHAAVAGAPVTDWRLYDTAYTERYLGDPSADAAPYDACSLLPRAPSLSRPLLLIHGLSDDNVVAAHTLQLSAALTLAGRPHEVLPLSGVTHMTPQPEVAENKLLLELAFLARHLRP